MDTCARARAGEHSTVDVSSRIVTRVCTVAVARRSVHPPRRCARLPTRAHPLAIDGLPHVAPGREGRKSARRAPGPSGQTESLPSVLSVSYAIASERVARPVRVPSLLRFWSSRCQVRRIPGVSERQRVRQIELTRTLLASPSRVSNGGGGSVIVNPRTVLVNPPPSPKMLGQ